VRLDLLEDQLDKILFIFKMKKIAKMNMNLQMHVANQQINRIWLTILIVMRKKRMTTMRKKI